MYVSLSLCIYIHNTCIYSVCSIQNLKVFFWLWIVEQTDVELMDIEDWLYSAMYPNNNKVI